MEEINPQEFSPQPQTMTISQGEQIDEVALAMLPAYRRLNILAEQYESAKAGFCYADQSSIFENKTSPSSSGKQRKIGKELRAHSKKIHREMVRQVSKLAGIPLDPQAYTSPGEEMIGFIREIERRVGRFLLDERQAR